MQAASWRVRLHLAHVGGGPVEVVIQADSDLTDEEFVQEIASFLTTGLTPGTIGVVALSDSLIVNSRFVAAIEVERFAEGVRGVA